MRPRLEHLAQRPIAEELPKLLEARGLTVAGLAKKVGVTRAHLSRALRGADKKKISPDLARRIAEALGLHYAFFAEYREGRAIKAIRHDPELRDRVYLMAWDKTED